MVTINIITNNMNTKETEEDPRYIRGQIYKITSPNTENFYIGSTILPLDLRFSKHKSNKDCSSMHIINEGNASIELIYEYPCKNRTELEAEEGRMMCDLREDGLDVINDRTAGAIAAAGGIKEYKKEYHRINKEKISKQRAEYYKINKEKITKQQAEYNKNRRPIYQCECCNKEFNTSGLNRHKKSAKYINNMKQINDISN